MHKVDSINNIPVIKILPLVALIKKSIYTLWILENSQSDVKSSFVDFEDNFYIKDIEEQKIDIYNSWLTRLANVDDMDEIIDCFVGLVYQLVGVNKIYINKLAIATLEDFKNIVKVVLNNLYEDIIKKKVLQF